LSALVYRSQYLQRHAPHDLRVIGRSLGGRLKGIHWHVGIEGSGFEFRGSVFCVPRSMKGFNPSTLNGEW
jgi:hypothetical protein